VKIDINNNRNVYYNSLFALINLIHQREISVQVSLYESHDVCIICTDSYRKKNKKCLSVNYVLIILQINCSVNESWIDSVYPWHKELKNIIYIYI
jgi:hypothetical protein